MKKIIGMLIIVVGTALFANPLFAQEKQKTQEEIGNSAFIASYIFLGVIPAVLGTAVAIKADGPEPIRTFHPLALGAVGSLLPSVVTGLAAQSGNKVLTVASVIVNIVCSAGIISYGFSLK